jgi:uroporphyrinogen decarboxylase
VTSKQRVLKTLSGERADRVPLNVYAGWNPGVKSRVIAKYGSLDSFHERFHIDIVTGVVPRFPYGDLRDRATLPELDEYLSMDMLDPLMPEILDKTWPNDLFLSVNTALEYHAVERGEKAVIAHIWGVLELSQFLFERHSSSGTEDSLINMLTETEKTAELYMRLARWSAGCVDNAARAGVDLIEISDDWGQQNTMLFNPELWWKLIYPATIIIVDAAKKHGIPVLMHSDGDITMVLDGVRKLGVSGLHPVQESAGMDPKKTRFLLGDMCIMG